MSAPEPGAAPAPPRCLVCGARDAEPWAVATDVEYMTTPDAFAYHRCVQCDVLFIDPLPSTRLAEIYPPNYYSFAPSSRSFVDAVKDRLDARALRALLRRLPATRLGVLDVGGGQGSQLDLLRALDPRVVRTVLVDPDPRATARARARGHDVFCGRIEDYPTGGSFDLILAQNLIEHTAAPGDVLARLGGLLAQDGFVLVQTPNFASLDARLFRRGGWGGLHCPRHWVLFTRASFTRVARAAGLHVVDFAYTQGAPFWAVSVLARLARAGLVTITRERPAACHPLLPWLSAGFAAFDFLRRPLAPTSQMVFVLGRAAH